MTRSALTLRILASVAYLWPYYLWRREVKRENQKRAIQQRVDQVIRGY